jgi:hypothetical protein
MQSSSYSLSISSKALYQGSDSSTTINISSGSTTTNGGNSW